VKDVRERDKSARPALKVNSDGFPCVTGIGQRVALCSRQHQLSVVIAQRLTPLHRIEFDKEAHLVRLLAHKWGLLFSERTFQLLISSIRGRHVRGDINTRALCQRAFGPSSQPGMTKKLLIFCLAAWVRMGLMVPRTKPAVSFSLFWARLAGLPKDTTQNQQQFSCRSRGQRLIS
jgi:hypothetical protein